MNNKSIARYALFLALAIIANYIEHLIPLPFVFPGVKLGLANSIGLLVLYYFDRKSYAVFGLMRVLISAILFVGFGSSFLISFGGTVFATLITILLVSFTKTSIYGISATAAVFHGIGQVVVVSMLYNTVQMMRYVFILSISGVVTGLLMAFVTAMLIKKLPKQLIK